MGDHTFLWERCPPAQAEAETEIRPQRRDGLVGLVLGYETVLTERINLQTEFAFSPIGLRTRRPRRRGSAGGPGLARAAVLF